MAVSQTLESAQVTGGLPLILARARLRPDDSLSRKERGCYSPTIEKSVCYNFCAEGGDRTHMGEAHTILSRARLPIPPLRHVGQI